MDGMRQFGIETDLSVSPETRFVSPKFYMTLLEKAVLSVQIGPLESRVVDALGARKAEISDLPSEVQVMTLSQLRQDVHFVLSGVTRPNQMELTPLRNDYSRETRDGSTPLPR